MMFRSVTAIVLMTASARLITLTAFVTEVSKENDVHEQLQVCV